MGQNFSWLKQVGHELEQQRARNLRNAVRRICVKIECKRLCNPIKGQSNCQPIHKNYTYWWKNLDWCWIRKTFALRLSSVEEIDPSSSSWKPTSRQWRSDWILENKRSSSESFLVLSSLVWRKVKEQHGRVRTKENISELFWFYKNNSAPPSSSRSFRTQFHWSYSTGQCPYSERFASTTFITSDVQSIYIPSSIQDWHRKDKIWATDRQYSFCLWIPWTKNTRILTRSTWKHRVLHNTCMKHGTNIRTRCGSTSTLLWRKNWTSERTLSFFTKHFQLIVSRKLFGWKPGKVIYEKVYASLRPPPKISLKHDWMKDLGSEVARQPEGEVARQAKSSKWTQLNLNPNHDRTRRPVVCPQGRAHHTRFSRDSRNFNLEEEANHHRTGQPVVNCDKSDGPKKAISRNGQRF